jgi:Bacteriophage T4 gp5 C-terminal trimerisation domain
MASSVGGNRSATISGNETITIHGSRTERVDTSENVTVGANRTESVGNNESVAVGANRTETVAGALRLERRVMSVSKEAPSRSTAARTCSPAARAGDLVASPALTILTGSPTVCIG